PDADGDRGRVAERPVVAEARARAALHGGGERELEGRHATEARDARVGIAQDVAEQVRVLRGENAQSGRCRALVEDPTRRIANARDGEGLRELASGAERRVGVREIEEPYLAATEGQAQAVALDLRERSEP